MILHPFRFLFGACLTCVFLAVCPRLQAQTHGTVAALREAYFTLAAADHDYKGHRAAAMKQIEQAVKLLGGDVKGDGKNRERQGASDAQLRAAQNLLHQASPTLSGAPAKHVDQALKQLTIALSIK